MPGADESQCEHLHLQYSPGVGGTTYLHQPHAQVVSNEQEGVPRDQTICLVGHLAIKTRSTICTKFQSCDTVAVT